MSSVRMECARDKIDIRAILLGLVLYSNHWQDVPFAVNIPEFAY